jgi:hypothetical protein
MRRAALLTVVALSLTGCAGAPGVEVFPAGARVDYQLGGAYEPAAGVDVVVRDSTADADPARYSVCYVNAFQTQPGERVADGVLLADAQGDPLVDPDWPDERIVDIRAPEALDRAAAVVRHCAEAGFEAVEFDNLDSTTRSDGMLEQADAVAFATRLAAIAHGLGLAAGQKNTADLGAEGRDVIGFDFAVVEECDRFDECAAYTDVYGDAVIAIEYDGELRRPFEQLCADPDAPRSVVLRDRELLPAGADGHRARWCETMAP